MRISMMSKKITLLLSGLMAAVLLTGCGGDKPKEESQVVLEQRQVELTPMNAIEMNANFVHLLDIETMPEDATGNNTFIIPKELTPRFMVRAADKQKFQTDLIKDKLGKSFPIYDKNQIIVPYSELELQVIKCGYGNEFKDLKIYTVELDQKSADTNKIYLIALGEDDLITPTDLENYKEAEEKAKQEAKELEEKENNEESVEVDEDDDKQ